MGFLLLDFWGWTLVQGNNENNFVDLNPLNNKILTFQLILRLLWKFIYDKGFSSCIFNTNVIVSIPFTLEELNASGSILL